MVVTVSLDGRSSIENISLADSPPPVSNAEASSSQQTAERIHCLTFGEPDVFIGGDVDVFEAVSIFDPNAEIPRAHEVCVTYVNGSAQTLLEAQGESLYLSEVRGEPVRLLYNSGRGGGGFALDYYEDLVLPLLVPYVRHCSTPWNTSSLILTTRINII
ncbi:transmembrane protein [Chlamydia abortus]|nr:transmembrane protein [Chlamydia abortus]